MDTNLFHKIYAVRSKYVKNTIHDLRQKLLPNIFRNLLGGLKLFYCGKIVSAQYIKPLPSQEFRVQDHKEGTIKHILVGIRVELQGFTVCIFLRNFDSKIRNRNTQD